MSSTNASSIHRNLSPDEKIELLFKEQYASLCNGVNRLLKDESLSEDLVQEVFIKVWEKKDAVTIDDRFIFYLKRSCYHAALKFLSSKSYQLETDSQVNIQTTESTDEDLLINELHLKIQQAIAALPEKTQIVFTLSRFEELSYKEISHQLDISIKTVEKHMGKALQLLRSSLKEHLLILLLMNVFNNL